MTSEIDTSTVAVTALLDGLTPGPWTPIGAADSDTEFLSAARHLVPVLLAERDASVARAERAEARVEELEAEVERMRDRVQTLGTEGHAYHAGRIAAAEMWHAERDALKAENEKMRGEVAVHRKMLDGVCNERDAVTRARDEALSFCERKDAEIARLREALTGIERACEQLAATRTRDVYLAMIDSGQGDALMSLDAWRQSARAALRAEQKGDA